MKKKDKKIGNSRLMIMIVCAALVTIGAVMLFFSLFAVYKVYDIKMAVTVAENSAFNIDSEMVHFGKAQQGNTNSRIIVMSHEYRKPLLIHFQKSGNISRFVELPQDFYLEPGLTKEITLSAVIPGNAPMGDYEGSLRIYFRRI
ncbi:hypothetical protein KY359_05925 [Candidatus Woesearchaeota archaeon]|nr:hypothetical protein [Candidatus Woesearchaeota archaeon]